MYLTGQSRMIQGWTPAGGTWTWPQWASLTSRPLASTHWGLRTCTPKGPQEAEQCVQFPTSQKGSREGKGRSGWSGRPRMGEDDGLGTAWSQTTVRCFLGSCLSASLSSTQRKPAPPARAPLNPHFSSPNLL